MRTFLIVLIVAACGTEDAADPLPTCEELACTAITCGDLTPGGDAMPTMCTCALPDGTYDSCIAD